MTYKFYINLFITFFIFFKDRRMAMVPCEKDNKGDIWILIYELMQKSTSLLQ